jgi:hypothetical protein
MSWWRVELDSSGAILKCRQVEALGKGNALITFVQANTNAEACKGAKMWYERRKAWRRKSDKRLSKARRESGLCRSCTEPVCSESIKFCKKHLEQNRLAQQRYYRGETQPKTRPPVEAIRDRENAYHRQRRALTAYLPDVLKKYDELIGGNSAFRLWLVGEIKARHASVYESEAAE